MKRSIQLIILSFSLAVSMQASATIINSETAQTNPSSTDDLWTYSYLDYNHIINGSAYYYTASSQYAGAEYQGYVTGEYGPWSATSDSFASTTDDDRNSHIFETYIVSSIEQTVLFRSGGDDGHTIFVDDLYTNDLAVVGTNTYGAGAGYAVTAGRYLTMEANVSYKITLAGVNYGGPSGYWFSMSGMTDQGVSWGGAITDADEYNITMNATDDFGTGNTIPEPATLALMGLGLAGIGYRRKAK